MSNKINLTITKKGNFVIGIVCTLMSFASIYNFIKYGDANYMKWGEAKGNMAYIYIGFCFITGSSLILSSLSKNLKNSNSSDLKKRF